MQAVNRHLDRAADKVAGAVLVDDRRRDLGSPSVLRGYTGGVTDQSRFRDQYIEQEIDVPRIRLFEKGLSKKTIKAI